METTGENDGALITLGDETAISGWASICHVKVSVLLTGRWIRAVQVHWWLKRGTQEIYRRVAWLYIVNGGKPWFGSNAAGWILRTGLSTAG